MCAQVWPAGNHAVLISAKTDKLLRLKLMPKQSKGSLYFNLEMVSNVASASHTMSILAVSRTAGETFIKRRQPQSSREAKTAISPEWSLSGEIHELKSMQENTIKKPMIPCFLLGGNRCSMQLVW